jgi:hypothetical protein
MDSEDFGRQKDHFAFLSAVEESLQDFDACRVISDDELGRMLDERFGSPPH